MAKLIFSAKSLSFEFWMSPAGTTNLRILQFDWTAIALLRSVCQQLSWRRVKRKELVDKDSESENGLSDFIKLLNMNERKYLENAGIQNPSGNVTSANRIMTTIWTTHVNDRNLGHFYRLMKKGKILEPWSLASQSKTMTRRPHYRLKMRIFYNI